MSEPLTVEALAEISRTQGKRAAYEALTGHKSWAEMTDGLPETPKEGGTR